MTTADLVEIEHIKRLKYRYMRCLDQKRWSELSTCFTDDATCAYSGGRYAFSGRERIMEFLRLAMDRPTFLSSHRVHHPEIELTGPTSATGVWALEDYVVDTANQLTIHGAAFYTDAYVKVGGEWKIRHTGYERTFEEVLPREGIRLTASFQENTRS
jgi:hypothetical protein